MLIKYQYHYWQLPYQNVRDRKAATDLRLGAVLLAAIIVLFSSRYTC